jgi:hypothetical protein
MVEGEWRTIATTGNLPTLNSSNKIFQINYYFDKEFYYSVSLKQDDTCILDFS